MALLPTMSPCVPLIFSEAPMSRNYTQTLHPWRRCLLLDVLVSHFAFARRNKNCRSVMDWKLRDQPLILLSNLFIIPVVIRSTRHPVSLYLRPAPSVSTASHTIPWCLRMFSDAISQNIAIEKRVSRLCSLSALCLNTQPPTDRLSCFIY